MGTCLGVGRMVFHILRAAPLPPPDHGLRRPESYSAKLTVKGRPLKLHALPTGTVTIKNKHMCCACHESTNYPSRFADILGDEGFAEPSPVYTFVVEHPDGCFGFDTGTDPHY
eukprot:TRINITY_DN98820_c0_g1_i1.p1 TRINITY_DN98820_c0_g1~~TRINITY_DN98820_c0_g1_i1.p1  ORF type:complete len:113 (-),score=18.29 TRINITY_DN98820_c0_g1_i1:2-340(-)